MKSTVVFNDYFCGNKISDYGLKHGFVDYRTLAKSFDAVLCNNIPLEDCEIENGDFVYYEDSNGNLYTENERDEKIEELKERIEELEENNDDGVNDEEIEELQADIEKLDDAYENDIFQYYIISDNGAKILKDYTNEIVFYNSTLDIYVWGVTHYGTSWDYVLTDIPCNKQGV